MKPDPYHIYKLTHSMGDANYSEMIVAAKNFDEAKLIHPTLPGLFHDMIAWSESRDWTGHPMDVTVSIIGYAAGGEFREPTIISKTEKPKLKLTPVEWLDEVIAVRAMPGTWDHDPYSHGLLNGLLLAKSLVDGSQYEPYDPPKEWGKDKLIRLQQENDEAERQGRIDTGLDFLRKVDRCEYSPNNDLPPSRSCRITVDPKTFVENNWSGSNVRKRIEIYDEETRVTHIRYIDEIIDVKTDSTNGYITFTFADIDCTGQHYSLTVTNCVSVHAVNHHDMEPDIETS